jgi:hypothetical protein
MLVKSLAYVDDPGRRPRRTDSLLRIFAKQWLVFKDFSRHRCRHFAAVSKRRDIKSRQR